MEQTTKEALREQFDRIKDLLKASKPGSDEFGRLLKQWLEIHAKLMEEDKADENYQEKMKPWVQRLDVNTVLSAAVTIGVAVMMLTHEDTHVITSKVFSWIPKPRLK